MVQYCLQLLWIWGYKAEDANGFDDAQQQTHQAQANDDITNGTTLGEMLGDRVFALLDLERFANSSVKDNTSLS